MSRYTNEPLTHHNNVPPFRGGEKPCTPSLRAYKTVGERRYREISGLYWEDFEPGDVFEHRPGRTVLDVDNVYFSLLTLNSQPVHFDSAYAAKTEWKKLLVDSTFTLALLTGMSVRTVSAKVVANLGWDKVKATHPVSPANALCRETVLHKRESKSRPTQGIVTVSTRGLNQDNIEVMSFERTMLMSSPRPLARRGGQLLEFGILAVRNKHTQNE